MLDQGYAIEEGKKPVSQALKEVEGRLGAPVKVTGFVRSRLAKASTSRPTILAAKWRLWRVPTEFARSLFGFRAQMR